MEEVELLSNVTLAEDAETVALTAPAAQPSILDDVMAIFQRDDPVESVVDVPANSTSVAPEKETGLFGGVLALFSGDDAVAAEPAALVTSEEVAGPDAVAVPEMTIANIAEVGATEEVAPATGGVLGFFTGLLPGLGETTQEVAVVVPFTPPAFGEIAAMCNVQRSELGTKIAEASGYTIYDTQPGSVQIRPHFVTGFNDRCPRRFDAALVFLGDIGTHELVRYSKTRVTLDYSATDEAYEAIKASYCGVARGAPCGARLERLADDTTFVTAYKTFGAGPEWAEFLLHDGDVAAADIEG